MDNENMMRLLAFMALFGLRIRDVAEAGSVSEEHLTMALKERTELSPDFYRTLEANLNKLVEGRTRRVFEVELTKNDGASMTPLYAPIPPSGQEIESNPSEPNADTEAALAAIARQILGIPTLERRQSDSLDFHDLAVWSIREALLAAYDLGGVSAMGGKFRTRMPHLQADTLVLQPAPLTAYPNAL